METAQQRECMLDNLGSSIPVTAGACSRPSSAAPQFLHPSSNVFAAGMENPGTQGNTYPPNPAREPSGRRCLSARMIPAVSSKWLLLYCEMPFQPRPWLLQPTPGVGACAAPWDARAALPALCGKQRRVMDAHLRGPKTWTPPLRASVPGARGRSGDARLHQPLCAASAQQAMGAMACAAP